jgi:hypothetical protein
LPKNRPVLACLAALALAACGREEPPKPADPASKVEQAARQMSDAARQGDVGQVGEAMKQMGEALSGSAKVASVDFRVLREWMPESLAGMKRTASEGSRMNVMGIVASSAEAAYEDGKGGRIQLDVKDVGNLSGVAAMALAWVNVEIDKEGDSGYERTSTVGGRKAFEKYAKATRSGEYDVIVAGRFVVGMKASGVDLAAFRAIVAALDLDRLESLKTQGLPPPAAPPPPPKG